MDKIVLLPDLAKQDNFYQENYLLFLRRKLRAAKIPCQLYLINENTSDNESFVAINNLTDTYYLFDQILGINTLSNPLFLADLKIPTDLIPNFQDSRTDSVTFWQGEQRVLTVKLNKFGWVRQVVSYQSDCFIQDNYDVRGFKITTEYFDKYTSQVLKKEWFNNYGELIMTQQNSSIVIAANQRKRFRQATYNSELEIVKEFLLQHVDDKTLFIADTDPDTINLRLTLPEQFRFCFLITDSATVPVGQNIGRFHNIKYAFRTVSLRDDFLQIAPEVKQEDCQLITPVIEKANLSLSNKLVAKIIYWHTGEILPALIKDYLNQLLTIMSEQKDVELVIDATEVLQAVILQQLNLLIKDAGEKTKPAPINTPAVVNRVSCQTLAFQEEKKLMRQARIYLDTGTKSNFTLQLEALQAGIPQFARQSNGLITPEVNGDLVADNGALPEQLSLFLRSLDKWNNSVIENTRIIEQMKPSQVVEQWRELL
ncbi:hypothetical protein OZY43_03245 [Lactobacillus sp. ESL0785]|uniref:hypothetical protein n=1 Tax=Lactobacillus sp. ESL0785 TaxID=2983232 RepID=UPI0023FA0BEE|nr:hypothetical protein [Lactobacillus sp. ESL0785]WEV71431.1 hypothetical protein OZY43_03245 [Lactobacillus sp. ESL0785]